MVCGVPVVVVLCSVVGLLATRGAEEGKIAPDVKKIIARAKDQSMEVTLAPQAGDPQSSLFGTCLAASSTFQATFASIEATFGSEYIRYQPDSFQLRFPFSWQRLDGSYPTIFECVDAAEGGNWPMFKYEDGNCNVADTYYSLNDKPMCEDDSTDVVFILSTADFTSAMPRFLVGEDYYNMPIYAVVNEDLMTFEEAKAFCADRFQEDEFVLLVNEYYPLTVADFIGNVTARGYTNTNLWTGAEEIRDQYYRNEWYGNFRFNNWVNNVFPPLSVPPASAPAAYLDKTSNYLLKASDKSFKSAGALCTTYRISSAE